MDIYEPREDSELLAEVVAKYAKGKAVDIGTGSGILAQTAHDIGCTVTALEQNLAAVMRLRGAPYKVVLGNSILKLRGKFDTVVCNPPYLPNDEGECDPALHGGLKGYEYIVKVIRDVAQRLSPDGQFLFLISTLTKPKVVEAALLQQGYEWTIVAREKLFMEELIVYRATFILGEPAERIGVGWRSTVYAIDSGRVAVKVSTPTRAHKEGVLLRAANKVGVGPKLIKVKDDRVWMKRIYGERLDEWFAKHKDLRVLSNVLEQCYLLDQAGIRKSELNRPGTNVLVSEQKIVVLLDFERSIFSPKASNVAQFASWISARLDINVQAQARAYVKNPSRSNYVVLSMALGLPVSQKSVIKAV